MTISSARQKKVVRIALLIFISAFLLLFVMPNAFAEVSSTVIEWLEQAIQDVCVYFTQSHGTTAMLIFTKKGFAFNDTVSALFSSIISIMKAVALSFTMVYVFIAIINEAKSSQLQRDKAFRIILNAGLAFTFVIFSDLIADAVIDAMYALNNFIFSSIHDYSVAMNASDMAEIIVDRIVADSYFTAFTYLLIARVILLPLGWILDAIVYIISYSVIIELYIRRIFFPLAMGNIVIGGTRGPGFRYLKHFASLFIRIMLFVLGFYVVGYLSYAEIQQLVIEAASLKFSMATLGTTLLTIALYDIAALLFIKKATEMANDVFGG